MTTHHTLHFNVAVTVATTDPGALEPQAIARAIDGAIERERQENGLTADNDPATTESHSVLFCGYKPAQTTTQRLNAAGLLNLTGAKSEASIVVAAAHVDHLRVNDDYDTVIVTIGGAKITVTENLEEVCNQIAAARQR